MLMLVTQSVMAKDITQWIAVFDKQKQSQEAQFSQALLSTLLRKGGFAVGSRGHQLYVPRWVKLLAKKWVT